MNNLIARNKDMMSSREIAELYGKRHDDVLKKIRKLEHAYVDAYGGLGKFSESSYLNSQNKEQPEILLNKSQALFVASRFDASLHAKVQKRWEELELQAKRKEHSVDHSNAIKALSDPALVRGLLLNYSERVIALEDKVSEQKPKVEALELITHADGENCITDTAKILQVRPKDLFNLMSAQRWIYRRAGGKGWIAYQDKIQKGLLTHKVTTVTDIHTGIPKMIEHVLVTSKGLTALSMKIKETTT